MKAFIRKLGFFTLFFLAFSIIINGIFLVIIFNSDWDFIKRRESLNFQNPDYELLVLGSSLAEYAIDSELLTEAGIHSYNLALVGSSVKTNYVQLREYLHNYENKPKYVILAINSYLERFDQEGIQPVVEFTMEGHKYTLKDVPMTKFNWAGMELIKKAFRKEYRQTYVSYGHKKSIRIEPDRSELGNAEMNLQEYENAKYIGKIAGICNDQGIEFYVIDLPAVTESQNRSEIGPYDLVYNNSDTAEFYNLNSNEFCDFIDPVKDWSGMSHFNKYGAEKFTAEMIELFFSEGSIGSKEN